MRTETDKDKDNINLICYKNYGYINIDIFPIFSIWNRLIVGLNWTGIETVCLDFNSMYIYGSERLLQVRMKWTYVLQCVVPRVMVIQAAPLCHRQRWWCAGNQLAVISAVLSVRSKGKISRKRDELPQYSLPFCTFWAYASLAPVAPVASARDPICWSHVDAAAPQADAAYSPSPIASFALAPVAPPCCAVPMEWYRWKEREKELNNVQGIQEKGIMQRMHTIYEKLSRSMVTLTIIN